MRQTLDIETALYDRLTADSYSASAHAIPSTLGTAFPHIHVTRTGGYASDLVIESHQVDFDVYAANQAEAMIAASDLCGWIRDLGATTVGTYCYTSEILTLPYRNPDPRHPNIGRATVKAQLLTRVKEN